MHEIGTRIAGYRLTTAEILYRLPDFPHLLQSYIWQNLDLAPEFPVLHRFLDFWQRQLDGKVHSVRVGSISIVGANELRHAQAEFRLH
ncbi:MAG: Usg family protein [Aliidongia sp.]